MRPLCITAVCLFVPLLAQPAGAPRNGEISSALNLLYNAKYEQSRSALTSYSSAHPGDPLGYTFQAATYLFSALNRTGAMRRGFLNDERNITDARAFAIGPVESASFKAAILKARDYSESILAKNPDDPNALLAMCIVAGVQRDYLALVEHRLRESYDYLKESQSYSSRLLKVDPTAYDAYLTKGFTEYLVASLPFYLRWFMKIDDISVTKEQGLQDLRLAAQSGQYMRPFAQLLLAMFYLREKQEVETVKLLSQLVIEFPDNSIYRSELDQLQSIRRLGTN